MPYGDLSATYLYTHEHYLLLRQMNQRNSVDRRERFLRRYDYDDGTVIAADLNAGDDDVTVDTVDGAAIVVIAREDDREDEEFEFELPGPAASVDIENGVLTIGIHA